MGLLQKARTIVEAIARGVKRLDRQAIARAIPRKFPKLAQLQHIDLFLDNWEKNLVGALGAVVIISLGGIIWSISILNTVPVAAEGGTFQEVLIGNPRHINPLYAATDTDRTLTNIVYLPLCDSFNRNIPKLAATCEFTDNKTVVITLDEHTWHDGEPVTTEDVIFTIQAMQNKETGSPWHELARRVSIEADQNDRIIISAKQPLPELRTLVSLGVIPQHAWKNITPKHMINADLNLRPIGNGAFKIINSAANRDGFVQIINLEAYSDFNPRRPYLNELIFRIASDDAEASDMFRTRQVDAMFVTDPAETEELVKRDVHRYEITPPAVVSLFFNPAHATIFRKPQIREAFALAIDRASIVKNALKGNGTPIRSPFPTTMLKNPIALQVDTDTIKAAELFKKHPFGTASSTLSLGIPSLPTYQAIADNIKEQLAKHGVSVTPVALDKHDFLSYDLVLLGQDYGLGGNAASFWHSAASGGSGANYARYQIREVDTWLQQLQTETDSNQRIILLNKITKRLVIDDPAVFLFQPSYQYYISNKVHNVTIPEMGDASDRFRTVADWYINTERAHR